MMLRSFLVFATLVAVGATTPSARAASNDKIVNPATCLPYAPDTTAAELVFSTNGVYNPGTTSEKVICLLPRDQDAQYAFNELAVVAWYRVLGATPSRMTCTLYIGSTNQQDTAVVTVTAAGSVVSAGSRGYVSIAAGPETAVWAPVSMICLLPPKTAFGSIRFVEMGLTQVP
jgi:hypothetical protein